MKNIKAKPQVAAPLCNPLSDEPMFLLPTLETREKLGQWLMERFSTDQKNRLAAVWHWNRMLTWLELNPQNIFQN